jgi:uncharacterized protein with PIN domain
MSSVTAANAYTVRLRFHGDLSYFLSRRLTQTPALERVLLEKTSIKDVIESYGVPHTEVDLILVNGEPVGFSHQLHTNGEIDVFSTPAPPQLFPSHRLQQRRLTTFVADGHLGKLARNLRLLGIDVHYDNRATDRQLLAIATVEQRALLTRDRRLLMHAVVQHGYCPRSHLHEEQTLEVVRRFDLADVIAPYTRCLRCNGLLIRTEKSAVLDQLEPLTRIYYEDFRRCTECGRIYWPGSHFGKLQARIERIRAQLIRTR